MSLMDELSKYPMAGTPSYTRLATSHEQLRFLAIELKDVLARVSDRPEAIRMINYANELLTNQEKESKK